MEKLALFGGEKAKTTPFGTGKRFGNEELEQVREALSQNTLFYWAGKKVKEFTKKFADMYGMPYCVATSSGTAAIHAALGALDITEGDEVITTPVTDMGTIIGIIYQNAIPVFADIDPFTYNISPKSIEEKITDKTKAIIVVHLAGNAADMDEIMAIAKKHNIKVVEDCAQAYLTYYKGRLVGTIGDIGCFSLNDFKHISAGDGGMVVMNDEEVYKKAFRFVDKNYNRFSDAPVGRDVDTIGINYRMNELTGAVAIAQLDRVEWICDMRKKHGKRISEALSKIPGITPHGVREGNDCSYWFYLFRIDPKVFGINNVEFTKALVAEGIPCGRGYIPQLIYEYGIFKNKSAYPNTHAPFDSKYYGKDIEYPMGLCPEAEKMTTDVVKLTVNEFYTDKDIDETIAAVEKIAAWYSGRK